MKAITVLSYVVQLCKIPRVLLAVNKVLPLLGSSFPTHVTGSLEEAGFLGIGDVNTVALATQFSIYARNEGHIRSGLGLLHDARDVARPDAIVQHSCEWLTPSFVEQVRRT